MKSKYRFRRILSGVMAAVTILSTFISPLTVYASEEPKAAEPPAYESVKDQLDENEVVKATDLELEVFIHGALCASLSGQCLFSSYQG